MHRIGYLCYNFKVKIKENVEDGYGGFVHFISLGLLVIILYKIFIKNKQKYFANDKIKN